jgi:hypothetical protein
MDSDNSLYRVTIIPVDGSVGISPYPTSKVSNAATGIDMTGVDPTIQAIQFTYNETTTNIDDPGAGYIDFTQDSGATRESIISVSEWHDQIAEAQAKIKAFNNPVTYWFFKDTNVDGIDYTIGDSYIVNVPNIPQPPNTTTVPVSKCPGEYPHWDESKSVWFCAPTPAYLNLEQAQVFAVTAVNDIAYNYLLKTDWMLIRKYDTGVPVPIEVTQAREGARQNADLKVSKIEACTTIEELWAYMRSPEYIDQPYQV